MGEGLEHIRDLAEGDRGSRLTRRREDQWFDRKSPRIQARDLADAMIGMANAEGGTLAIGIEDGEVVGIADVGDKRNDWRQAAVDFTVPPVAAQVEALSCMDASGERNELMIVEVAPSDRVHANQKDEVFLRIGDENRELTFEQRRELQFDKGQSNYEATPARLSSRSDLDEELVWNLAERLGHDDPDRLLQARGLMSTDGSITIGGVLLFGQQPQAELPESYVRVIRYRGAERKTGRRQQMEEERRLEGALPLQIEAGRRAVTDLIPTRRALGADGTFTDVGAVPADAWLEGLVNAVTHRAYSMAGDHIRVEIFDDRVEIESPGRFPGIVDLSSPQDVTRFARNPRIARVLADFDFGQELGEGIRRMFEEMRLAGLAEPQYQQTSGSVRLSLSAEPVDRALEDRLPPIARDLVRMIRERQRASTGDLVNATGRSRPVVLKALRSLQDEEIVKWVGTSKKDPRAYWRLRTD